MAAPLSAATSQVLFILGMALPNCCDLRKTACCLCFRAYNVVQDAPAYSVIQTKTRMRPFEFCDLQVLGRSTFLTEKQVNPVLVAQVSRAQLTSDDCVAVRFVYSGAYFCTREAAGDGEGGGAGRRGGVVQKQSVSATQLDVCAGWLPAG